MQFSSRLPIAVHTLLVIAVFKDQYKITSDFIAGSVGVNPVIVRNVLGQLKSANLVEVTAGIGGAALNRPPAEITLLDVFRAVEVDEDLFHFHEHPNPDCLVGKSIHNILGTKLDDIKKTAELQLKSITLQSLLDSLPNK
ncbi:MAG: Rrf2 family transcriptional regulator [Selenomonadaceae bacterium]|nr:Rrf2 family transcriptional regulator [Selenomonadaceae bacterium]